MPGSNGGILPQDWFHAIDTGSYKYYGHSGVPETRRDTSCRYHCGEGMITSYALVNKSRREREVICRRRACTNDYIM